MKLLPPLLFFFTLFIASFAVCRAVYCKIENSANAIIVDKSGKGKYSTIQGAINSIPLNNDQWIKIQINPGIYKEQVTIPQDKPCIILEGQDRRITTITYDAHDRTDTSSTFSSFSENIVAKGITFKNSYDLQPKSCYHALRHDTYFKYNGRKAVAGVTQAVAARIKGDKSAFYGCGFLGLQDTLWSMEGRHYFSNCYIEGVVDFIFGDAQAFFESCLINVTANLPPFRIPSGYITAQKREAPNDPGGFVFRGGTVTGTGKAFLGRAWGRYSRVIFQETTLSSVVIPEGWNAWGYQGQEGNFMYAEINCKGPGSDTSKRVSWEKKLDATKVNDFSRDLFINDDGWIDKQVKQP